MIYSSRNTKLINFFIFISVKKKRKKHTMNKNCVKLQGFLLYKLKEETMKNCTLLINLERRSVCVYIENINKTDSRVILRGKKQEILGNVLKFLRNTLLFLF